MRAPRSVLTINRRHPDARGLVLAVPFNQGGGATLVPKVASGVPVTAGTDYGNRSWAIGRYGWHVKVSGTTNAGNIWGSVNYSNNNRMSVSALIHYYTADGSYPQSFLKVSAADMLIGTDAKLQLNGTSYGPAMSIGEEHQVGFSAVSATSGFFYIDGKQYTLSAFPTFSAGATGIYTNVGAGSPIGWGISDIRVWNRLMPQETFQRHYEEGPTKFYNRSRVGHIRSFFGGNFGRFLPFMHPSLTS